MNTAQASRRFPRFARLAAIGALFLTAGCASTAERLASVGKAPEMSPIVNPTAQKDYQPVSVPMPRVERASYMPNSLWRQNARAFFRDQRASRVGDILTVNIDITDKAEVANTTSRSRSSGEDADITNLLGVEGSLAQLLPSGFDPASLASFGSNSNSAGTGRIEREEEVALTLAAMVVETLPNGNFVIMGRQEVRVNFEVRELIITGIVRPEDISNANTIDHTQIAEARISYGGKGQITDLQQPRWGQQVYDVLFPF
jgi:flagellar L-ring protein precursor FlgH